MKRTTIFLPMLIIAFIVSFCFLINSASGAVIKCPSGRVTALNPCTAFIDSGDELIYEHNRNLTLNFRLNNGSSINEAKIIHTIGVLPLTTMVINPNSCEHRSQKIENFVRGSLTNNSQKGTIVKAEIVASRNDEDDFYLVQYNKQQEGSSQNNTRTVSVRADNGKYLSRIQREGIDYIVADKSELDPPFTEFKLINLPNGKIALLADNGKYLSRINRCDINPIEAAKDDIDPYSQFQIIHP